MIRNGVLPLVAAFICFVLFFSNVAIGANGGNAPLDDVAEMLMLFASAALFVFGVLEREAHDSDREDNND